MCHMKFIIVIFTVSPGCCWGSCCGNLVAKQPAIERVALFRARLLFWKREPVIGRFDGEAERVLCRERECLAGVIHRGDSDAIR
jgi:hypothetical protein